MFISDVITSIASGGLDYSDANRRKVLGSLHRCAAIYDTPAAHIPADVGLFEARWGRGKVKTYPLAHFASAEQFRDWRSNVRGAIAQATGARAAAAGRRAREDGWAELLAVFDANAGRQKDRSGKRLKLFDPKLRIGLERIADYARRECLEPTEITTAVLARLRDTYAVKPRTRSRAMSPAPARSRSPQGSARLEVIVRWAAGGAIAKNIGRAAVYRGSPAPSQTAPGVVIG